MRRSLLVWGLVVLCAARACAEDLARNAPPVFSLLRCTKLPLLTQMHGCAVVGTRLYVIAGNTRPDGWLNFVRSAEIQKDGRLGDWRDERPLPEMRHYINQSVEVVNNRIYVIGGAIADQPLALDNQTRRASNVLWTTVGADGTLSEWKASEPFTASPASCIATCSDEKRLYVVGGSSDSGISTEVTVGDLAADGSPANWRKGTPLPTPLWFHGSAIIDDTMYVWGGLTARSSESISAKTFSATVSADGTVGAWREESPMPYPTYSAAFCGFNDYLVAIGGRYKGAVFTNAIWYARIENKRVGQWQLLNTDLDTRVYHSLGLDKSRGFVYVTGGQYKSTTQALGNLLDTVQAFQISQPQQAKLDVSAAAPPAGVKFRSLLEARSAAAKSGKQILAFFYSPEVPGCKRFWDSVIATPEFQAAVQQYELAMFDVSKDDPSICSRYGVFKFPSLAILSANGDMVRMSYTMRTMDNVKELLGR